MITYGYNLLLASEFNTVVKRLELIFRNFHLSMSYLIKEDYYYEPINLQIIMSQRPLSKLYQ